MAQSQGKRHSSLIFLKVHDGSRNGKDAVGDLGGWRGELIASFPLHGKKNLALLPLLQGKFLNFLGRAIENGQAEEFQGEFFLVRTRVPGPPPTDRFQFLLVVRFQETIAELLQAQMEVPIVFHHFTAPFSRGVILTPTLEFLASPSGPVANPAQGSFLPDAK